MANEVLWKAIELSENLKTNICWMEMWRKLIAAKLVLYAYALALLVYLLFVSVNSV